MVFRNPFRRSVAPRRVSSTSGESDVSLAIVLCVLVMALTFVIVIPLLGIMYMDMNNAMNAAVYEARKMRELRKQIINERMKGEE